MVCILSAMAAEAAEAEVRPSQLLPCVLRPPFYPFLPWPHWPIPRRAQPLLPLVASLLQQLSLPLQRSPVYPHKLRKKALAIAALAASASSFLAISAARTSAIRCFSSALAFSYFLLWYHPFSSLHSLQQLRS